MKNGFVGMVFMSAVFASVVLCGFCSDGAPICTNFSGFNIPYLELKNARMSEVIDKLRAVAKERSSEKDGLNFVLLGGAKAGEKTVSVRLENIPLRQAVMKICAIADMHCSFDDHSVVIAPKNIPLHWLESRFFPLESEALSEWYAAVYDNSPTTLEDLDAGEGSEATNKKKYFERCGVEFPKGAKVFGDVFVVNTPDNLRRIEAIVNHLNDRDIQVVIDFTFARISKRNFDEIRKKNKDSSKKELLWKYVLEAERTEIVYSSSIMTENGQEASFHIGKEVFFPDSWEYSNGKDVSFKKSDKKNGGKRTENVWPTMKNLGDSTISTTPLPEFNDITKLGMGFYTTTYVDPDEYEITLNANLAIRKHIGWVRNYGNAVEVKMPAVKSFSFEAESALHDGEVFRSTAFLEDLRNDARPEQNYFMLFQTARVVNYDGVPIRKLKGELNPISPLYGKRDGKLIFRTTGLVKFEEVDIQEALRFFSEQCRKVGDRRKVVLKLSKKELCELPKISLQLRNVPLHALLKYICLATGLKYKIGEEEIVVVKRSFVFMGTRRYSVRRSLISRVLGIHIWQTLENSTAINFEMKKKISMGLIKYFSERGIEFPKGASMDYDMENSKLIMRNTLENIHRLSCLFTDCDSMQPQISVNLTCVAIAEKSLTSLLGKKVASSIVFTGGQMKKILNSDKGKILFSKDITGKSGNEVTTKTVTEAYFPESWEKGSHVSRQGNSFARFSLPKFLGTKDIGAVFSVTPTMSPNEYTISLDLSSKVNSLVGFDDYNWRYSKDGKEGREFFRMPRLSTRKLLTKIRIHDGRTLCVARARYRDFPELKGRSFPLDTSWTRILKVEKKENQELMNIFYFVSAKILPPDGIKGR